MFDRVTIYVSDLEASRRFYELADAPEGLVLEPGEPTENLHVAFVAATRADVDAWWRNLVDAGYMSDGEPGPRPQYSESYYGASVLDPDGNSVEAVNHADPRPRGVDHLWLRTGDVTRMRDRFVGVPGVGLRHDSPARVTFCFDDRIGSFTFVPGDPATRNVRLGDVLV